MCGAVLCARIDYERSSLGVSVYVTIFVHEKGTANVQSILPGNPNDEAALVQHEKIQSDNCFYVLMTLSSHGQSTQLF